MSIFEKVELVPADPILGLTDAYNKDQNPAKVNLGVGVYFDESGKLPLLNCVREAEHRLDQDPKPKGYLPIDGLPGYTAAVKSLVFGADSELLAQGKVVTVQALGGTGALKVGADFLGQLDASATVLISDPSWENHRALFTRAGFPVESYRYYTPEGVDIDGMLADLDAAAPGTIVVLHACCHNPTGLDLSPEQWDQVIEVCRRRQLTPFLDMAYQGFSVSVEEDGAAVTKFVDAGLTFLVSTSFSKSFSLYGERVGALSVVCGDADEAKRVLSQLKIVIRTNYSNPSSHGAQVVTLVLSDDALKAQWADELGGMRARIKAMRAGLVEGLVAAGVERDMSFITGQVGMFSYSGLSTEQMVRLREEFSVYGTDAGRMCVAALNEGNIAHVAASIAKVL